MTVQRDRVRGARQAAGLRPGAARRSAAPASGVGPGSTGRADRRPFVIAAVLGLVLATIVAGTLTWRAVGQAEDDLAARGFLGEINAARAFRAVAFAPDDARIFAATGTVVETWHLVTRRRTGPSFVGHTGPVTALAVSSTGRHLASAGDDGTARLWDITTGAGIGGPIDTGGVARPLALAFSRDGSMLAVSGDGGTALWDVAGRRLAGVLESASGAHAAAAFSPDGTRVATGDIGGGTVTIWDVATRQPVGEPLGGHLGNGPVSALSYDTSGTWLADGSADKASFVYNTNTREHSEFRQNEEAVHTVILTGDAGLLITACIQDVVIWDVPSVAQLGRPVVPDGSADVNDIALGPDGDTLAVIRDHRIQFWSVRAASRR